MDITLAKGIGVRKALEGIIVKFPWPSSIAVPTDGKIDIGRAFDRGKAEYNKLFFDYQDLVNTDITLRTLIGTANAKAKIDIRMTEILGVEKQLVFIKRCMPVSGTTKEHLQEEYDAICKGKEDLYSFVPVDIEMLERLKTQENNLNKRLETLRGDVYARNKATFITLPHRDEIVLHNRGLV